LKKYIVRLTEQERETLRKMISTGKKPARVITRARILLKADQSESGPAWKDEQISEALEVTASHIEEVRKQLVEEGFDAALTRRPYVRKNPEKKIDGEVEAHVIALSCCEPPEGYAQWSLRLLADTMVKLEFVDSISHESVRTILKKKNKTLAQGKMVYSAQGKRRICVRHGRCSGGLHPFPRSTLSAGLYG
jgi:hypothetical protein